MKGRNGCGWHCWPWRRAADLELGKGPVGDVALGKDKPRRAHQGRQGRGGLLLVVGTAPTARPNYENIKKVDATYADKREGEGRHRLPRSARPEAKAVRRGRRTAASRAPSSTNRRQAPRQALQSQEGQRDLRHRREGQPLLPAAASSNDSQKPAARGDQGLARRQGKLPRATRSSKAAESGAFPKPDQR